MTLQELKAYVRKDPALSRLSDWVEAELARSARGDKAHDFDHFYRVALWTVKLSEGKVEPRDAIAAALFHDLVSFPKNSPERNQASRLSAERAREVLPQFGFQDPQLSDICDAVRTHSFSRGEEPTSELGRCLQDADRLEALGAIGLYRVIATGVALGSELFEPGDPWARSRALDDGKYSVDHFFTKLLKLSGTMKTATGKAEAGRRTALLRLFLSHLADELGVPLQL